MSWLPIYDWTEAREKRGNHQVAGSNSHFGNRVFCVCIFSDLNKKKKLYVNMFKTGTHSIKMLLRATECRVLSVMGC